MPADEIIVAVFWGNSSARLIFCRGDIVGLGLFLYRPFHD